MKVEVTRVFVQVVQVKGKVILVSTLRLTIKSEGVEGAACEDAFEVYVALVSRNQRAQRSADARVCARELNHTVGEGAAPEVSVESAAHLRRAAQLAPEVRAPTAFIRFHVVREIAFVEQLSRAQSIVNPLACHGVCEARRVTEQRPVVARRTPRVECLGREPWDARRVTLGQRA